ncbi:NADP-dependent oxidoreductase [Coralloluteibacterium stylophorae]|uniref:NADP-dependent oxidoreductase n=1 Tax=Coralloluteibacterium stylophorae TaxID=1776034 RepID=A0A8J7VQH9_9GAMM|nr:NADP-dependent oxidoreductase [Coralloluteibacterium stylophorae]MBS7455521.1 NADP-dependent oxidoreductase [Coralloluteibacterium stylophorae]
MSASAPARRNRRIVLAKRPEGAPQTDDFRLEEAPLPEPREGQVLLRTLFLSLDPYMRGRMNAGRSYAKPVEVGAVMEGGTVAEVVASEAAELQPGDLVLAHGGWQAFSLARPEHLRRLDPDLAPPSTALGVLGMPGFTAYSGLKVIGKPREGETLVVAAATGPVGSAVGQIARILGLRAVGIAGGERKCRALTEEFGFDAAVDHRADDFPERLRAACPDGVDIYFENVGGPVLEAVLPLLNDHARIPVCGLVSQYNASSPPPGPDRSPALMGAILTRQLTVRGFIQTQFVDALQEPFLKEMGAWVREGRVRYREDIVDGLENAPEAFIGMLGGANFGKQLVRVAEPMGTTRAAG